MSATCPFCAGAGLVDDPGWSHPGRGYRADYPRTPGDGLIDCGWCDGDGVVPDDPAEALRAVIAKAVADLGTHTRVENYDNGDECDDCCDDWPCRYARVADDLRKAIEP